MSKGIIVIPKFVKIIIFILLIALLYSLYIGITIFIAHNGKIKIDVNLYLLISFSIGIVFFIAGMCFCSLFKSWDLQTFVDRIENPFTGRQIVYLLYDKFIFFNWKWVDIMKYESSDLKNIDMKKGK